ncbi:protein FAR1-RELATED SEQUENCE 5-like [Lactuca sativa]|uniref:protein FAR1-RELATED SEQUENCE 5-like n=1 Tax=Lactuca sativa TaxID=4236 RepID=UPI000CD9AA52|nr:protein FAR1-RELATED SEQUENCE 5-like [Lactuca sativa]
MEQPNNNQDQSEQQEEFDFSEYDTLDNVNLQIVDTSNINDCGYSYANLGSDTLYNYGLSIGESSKSNEAEFEDAEIDNYSSDDDDIAQNIDLLREQSAADHDYVSPGGSMYWTLEVSDHIKPKIKSIYDSYVDAVRMYRNYALEVGMAMGTEAGFDVRLGTLRTSTFRVITERHLLCNHDSKPNTGKVDALDIQHNKPKRRKDSFRVDCKAKIVLKIIPGTVKYVVHDFTEKHSHALFSKETIHLSRAKRKLDYAQESFIHNMSKQNIGATKAHRFYTGITGCHSDRGLLSDFKNSTRNLNCFIGGRDSKFLVDKMNERKKYVPNFTFEYRVVDKKLNSLFWADETTKFNYNAFGDVVSLDATFNTNRYNMAFLKTFTKPPTLMLSDQDPTLSKAIKEFIPTTQHKLCMWHITKNLPKKISIEISTNLEFRNRFHGLIGNSKIEPQAFEAGWECLLRDFNITKNKWLNAMYGLRRLWIPSFFKDIPMSGLMRTMSFSESQNWSFQNNTLYGLYFVIFMMSFETNLERQRHNQIFNDFKTSNTFPKMIKHLPYEVHASKVYTRTIFYQVQEEILKYEDTYIQKCVSCEDGVDTFTILEKKTIVTRQTQKEIGDETVQEYHYDRILKETEFKVTHSTLEDTFVCSCMNFEHSC